MSRSPASTSVDSGPRSVTVSVGYTTSTHGETDGLALVRRADRALYRAKREGRNRTCSAGDEADESAEHGVGVLARASASYRILPQAAPVAPVGRVVPLADTPPAAQLRRRR